MDEREGIKENDNPIFKEEDRSKRNDLWRGIGIALLLHLIQVPLAIMTWFASAIILGITQLLYIVPLIMIYRRKQRPDVVKGLIIVAVITFLLNATCVTLFFASANNMPPFRTLP